MRFGRIALIGVFWPALAGVALAAELNLYTAREPGLIEPLLKSFTAASGIKVNTIFVKDGLAERVAAEGARSPADLLMTVDIGKLTELVEKGLTQKVSSKALEEAVPANLRDPGGQWLALSLRARVVIAAKNLKPGAVTYESLADKTWMGKLCTRSGQHPYNTALIAAYIAHHGEAKAKSWLEKLKANLARKPGGGDRDVARDITAGLCDIGIANNYYVGLMRSGKGGPEQVAWAQGIQMLLPRFENGGTHVNVSGAALAKHAPNAANAVKLLEYLVSDEAQRLYAQANFEVPVKAGVAVDPLVSELGALKPDSIPLTEIAKHRAAASRLVDETGFDE